MKFYSETTVHLYPLRFAVQLHLKYLHRSPYPNNCHARGTLRKLKRKGVLRIIEMKQIASLMVSDSSIPYTTSPMMRNDPFFAGLFFFLHGIVQKEVDQDRVYFCFGMLAYNLASYHFYAPDAASCVAKGIETLDQVT